MDDAAAFLAGLSADRRATATAVHEVVRTAAPGLTPWIWRGVMWGGAEAAAAPR